MQTLDVCEQGGKIGRNMDPRSETTVGVANGSVQIRGRTSLQRSYARRCSTQSEYSTRKSINAAETYAHPACYHSEILRRTAILLLTVLFSIGPIPTEGGLGYLNPPGIPEPRSSSTTASPRLVKFEGAPITNFRKMLVNASLDNLLMVAMWVVSTPNAQPIHVI